MSKKLFTIAFAVTALFAMTSCHSPSAKDNATAASVDNAALENILTRYSVRQYQTGRTISKDTVEMLLRAAMSAPTAVNKQPWQFIVVDQREILDSLAAVLPNAKMLAQVPLAIIPCGDLSKAYENEPDYWIQDVSAASENLLLAAHALGLGAVWTGVYPNKERVQTVSERIGLPANIIPLAVVPIGYPEGEPTPKDKWNPDNVHYNHW